MMKRASLVVTVIILTMCLVLVGCGSNSGSSSGSSGSSSGSSGSSGSSSGGTNGPTEKHNFRMSIAVGEASSWYLAAQEFAKEVNEKSNGRITIDLYANNVLSGGDNGKAIELLIQGQTDLSYDSTIIYSIFDPRFGIISAPFMFQDWEEVDRKLGGEGGEAIKEILREKGVEPLGFGQNGFRQVTNNTRPVKSPDDLKGLKVRIPGIKMYVDLWERFGANPVQMSFSELFPSLQQGVVDGQENPIDLIYSSKFNEVQKYLTMWNYSYDAIVLGMNKKTFDSLHPEDQKIIREAAAKANEYQIKLAREKETEQIKELEKSMEFHYPTEAEMNVFRETVKPIYEAYESVWGKELLDAFRSN